MIDSVELVIKQPGHSDRVVKLQEGATRLGRAEDNEVVLSDVGVSRRHAQVYVSRGEVTVEDLGSGNGTYYNGYRVQSQPVNDGDEIVIDPFVLQFRVRGQQVGRGAEGRGESPARLEVVVGTGMAGSSYPIAPRGLSIGRSEDRDVVIPDPAASRHHCQISLQSGEYVLRDMGSANGVFVNAVRVRECTLADGDLIRIGNTEMRFVRYDGGASDNTTQVVPSQDWSQQAAWQEPPMPEPPRRKGRGGIVALVLGTLVILGGMLLVLAIVVVGVVVWLRMQPAGPPQFEAQPPRWQLEPPKEGLPSAPVDELFEAGREKMRTGDRRAALMDFYRVLQADPSYMYVDKFAYAAGEHLVLEVLEEQLEASAAARREREALRDELLRLSERRGRTAYNAKVRLEAEFREDPVVNEHFGWKATDRMREIEKKAAGAAKLLADESWDEAAAASAEVLAEALDPDTRTQALAQLKSAQREVARQSADLWTKAVVAEASGDTAQARQLLEQLATEHPANPSAPLRLSHVE